MRPSKFQREKSSDPVCPAPAVLADSSAAGLAQSLRSPAAPCEKIQPPDRDRRAEPAPAPDSNTNENLYDLRGFLPAVVGSCCVCRRTNLSQQGKAAELCAH